MGEGGIIVTQFFGPGHIAIHTPCDSMCRSHNSGLLCTDNREKGEWHPVTIIVVCHLPTLSRWVPWMFAPRTAREVRFYILGTYISIIIGGW